MKTYKLFFFFLFCCASCLAPPAKPAHLRTAFSSYPMTFDPRKSGDFTSASIICILYEGLTRCGANEEICLATASKVDISNDGKTYTFFLRKTNWTDGVAITAHDFSNSWKTSINPNFPSLSPFLFFPIKNVERYIQGKASMDEVGIYVIDDYTLKVELEKPTPYFLSLTAFPLYLPFPSHLPGENHETNLVCNGPFKIERTIHNNEIFLVKNNKFWNEKNISLDSIHISILPDEITALQMFERKELDFVGGPLSPLPPDALVHLSEQGLLHFIPTNGSTFCTFNIESAPFNNVSIRKAFSYAIDRDQILKESRYTGQIPASTMLPPGLSTEKNEEIRFDPSKAQQLLLQGLEEEGLSFSDLSQITLYYRQGQVNQRLAQTLQKIWKEVLGITFKIEQLDHKSHLQKLHKKDYQIAMASWIAQYHDPMSLLERFKFKENPKNFPNWEDMKYIALLEKASNCTDLSERTLALQEAERFFLEQLPIIPLYHWTAPYVAQPNVHNISTTASGGILLENFSL